MGIKYDDLDAPVRLAMVAELGKDQGEGKLYISPRLTDQGAKLWPAILHEAFEQHNDTWVADQLRLQGLLRTEETRRKPSGGVTVAKVPVTAADTLAEGEFNRFYARALCVYVVASGGTEVEVYRGKEVQNPRAESQALLGRRLLAQQLMDDLRASSGVEPALGLPPGPNSGLTIRQLR